MTTDYSFKMQDRQGRRVTLCIIGACVDELVATGLSQSEAVESVEGNAFQNAIARGEIGEDAWIFTDE